MKNEEIKKIIDEIIKKSENCNDGFIFPEECKINISDLENYNYLLFSELAKIERILTTSKSNYFDKIETLSVPLIKIDGDCIVFYSAIIKNFYKELNQ